MTFWKINCMETTYPGMWQRWYVNQCVAVGWAGSWGFHLQGKTDGGHGWSFPGTQLRKMIGGSEAAAVQHDSSAGRQRARLERLRGQDGADSRKVLNLTWMRHVDPDHAAAA